VYNAGFKSIAKNLKVSFIRKVSLVRHRIYRETAHKTMQPLRNDQPTPPPQFPASAPPQLFVSPPAAQEPPKKRLSIVWIVLAIIAVPVFGEQLLFGGQRHTGVSYQGQELTPSESKSAIQDIAAMTSHVRAGDPTSFDTSYEPQTEIGQRFKTLLISAQKLQADYAEGTKDAHSPTYLSPKELGNPDGRKEAHRIHDKFGAATKKFRDGTANYQESLSQLAADMSGKPNGHLQEFRDQDQELARLDTDEMASIEKLIDFTDSSKPTYDARTGKLNFRTDADVAKYKSIYAEIVEKEHSLVARRMEIMKSRQSMLRQSMTTLQGYAK